MSTPEKVFLFIAIFLILAVVGYIAYATYSDSKNEKEGKAPDSMLAKFKNRIGVGARSGKNGAQDGSSTANSDRLAYARPSNAKPAFSRYLS